MSGNGTQRDRHEDSPLEQVRTVREAPGQERNAAEPPQWKENASYQRDVSSIKRYEEAFKNVCPHMMMEIEVTPTFRDSEHVQTHCFGCDSCVKLTIAHSEDRVPIVMSGQTFLKPPRLLRGAVRLHPAGRACSTARHRKLVAVPCHSRGRGFNPAPIPCTAPTLQPCTHITTCTQTPTSNQHSNPNPSPTPKPQPCTHNPTRTPTTPTPQPLRPRNPRTSKQHCFTCSICGFARLSMTEVCFG